MKRVVFVTGASQGIGAAICTRFREAGDQIAGCSSSEASAKNIPADLALACDVTKREAVEVTVRKIVEKFGRIDVVVNNAGLSGSDPWEPGSSDDLWNRILDVNLNGTYHVCKAVIPHMPDRRGRIINLSSVLGLKGVPDGMAYCAAKHGVIGLTRSLAHYVAPRGITVNAIAPGWVRTRMAQERMKEIGVREEGVTPRIPLGRILEPKEIAATAFYLASLEAGGLTGQTITVDGGVLA